MPDRPNIDELLQRAAEKYTREQSSATARKTKSEAFKAASDTDFADAAAAQMAARQGELARNLYGVADTMGDSPELAPAKGQIESIAMSLYQQGESFAAASDQADPA